MIHFFSNHSNTQALEELTQSQVQLIPHPYIDPEWPMDELREKCKDVITKAAKADTLIINGDYSIVAVILLERARLGKQTGFICMKKFNEPTDEKDKNGNIIHTNVLKPVSVRWI